MTKTHVYVIECLTANHFYVGATQHLIDRIRSHRRGGGARATAKFGFKKLAQVIEVCDMEQAKKLEKLLVLRLRQNAGYIVYGAGWTPTKETGVPNGTV